MKRSFKKLLASLLICVLAFSCVSVCSAGNIDVLKGLEIAPDSISEAVGDQPITRGEYAYMMANILNGDDMDPMDTRFTDVTKADYFSGQVEYLATRGVAGGYGDGTFGKNDPLTLETAYVFLIRLLGYESFVRINENSNSNFTTFAYTIGLKPGTYTNADGFVTKSGAAAIVHDALTAELPKAEWSTEGGELILNTNQGATTNLLSKNLGISAYDAYVQGVDMEKYTITLKITKNKYNTNPLVIAEGTVKTFLASTGVNIYEYDHTPVSVWINEDEKIVDIQYKKDVEIRYVNILSVNGDDEEHSYRVGNIERMTFLDDEEEYDVAQDATYKLNGENFTGQTALAGNYAKVVLLKDEIIYVESWDLVEGGIIEEIADDRITYKQGNTKVILRGLDEYKTKMYFIGGRNASANELKEGTLFYYYKNEATGYIAFVVSEVVITDVLESVGTDFLTIGNNIISYSDKFYFQTEGETFKTSDTNRDFIDLYGKNVHAYVAHNGEVRYLFPEDASLIDGSFYGVVLGVEPDRWEPDEFADIRLYEIHGTEITEKVYKYIKGKSRSSIADGIDLDELKETANDPDGKSIYLFRVNDEGLITQIKRPQPFPGFETAQTSYINLAQVDMTLMQDGKSLYIQSTSPVTIRFLKAPSSIIYKLENIDGNLAVSTLTVSQVKGQKAPADTKLIVYGDGNSLKPAFLAFAGKGAGLVGKDSGGSYGVITKKTVVNVDGYNKTNLVIEGLSGVNNYYVENTTASKYSVGTLIKYSLNPEYEDDQIYISGSADISSDDPTKWDLTELIAKLKKGEVVVAQEEGIIFKDTVEFYRPNEVNILIVDLREQERTYEKGSTLDVEDGDYIFYDSDGSIRNLAIVVKR